MRAPHADLEALARDLRERGAMRRTEFVRRFGRELLERAARAHYISLRDTEYGPVVGLGTQGCRAVGLGTKNRRSQATLADEAALRRAVERLEAGGYSFVELERYDRARLADPQGQAVVLLAGGEPPGRVTVERRLAGLGEGERLVVAHDDPERLAKLVAASGGRLEVIRLPSPRRVGPKGAEAADEGEG